MNGKGLTLVELVVTLSIIIILAAALGFSFQGWRSAYAIEGAVKTIYADMMDARARAMQMNVQYLAEFKDTQYTIAHDDSSGGTENLTIDSGEALPTFPKTPGYKIKGKIGSTDLTMPVDLSFSKRGIISQVVTSGTSKTNQSIGPNQLVIYLDSTYSPDYDCVSVYATEIHMGKMQSGSCNER